MSLPVEDVKALKWVGKSVPREDGAQKATGQGVFATDMHLPGMLYGKYHRSKFAHAKILNIDLSKALKVPGVKAIVTAKDYPKDEAGNLLRFGPYMQDGVIFAHKKARYIGEPIAAIAAADEDTAAEAAELIDVDYEQLPAVFDPMEAMRPDAPIIHEDLEQYLTNPGLDPIRSGNVLAKIRILRGDPEKAFQEADHVVEQKFRTTTHHQGYMEPHAALAQVEADGKVTVWTSTQSVSTIRMQLLQTLLLTPGKVRVVAPFIGGGFGGKVDMRVEPHAILLAQKTGRPVQLVLTREEEFISGNPRHPFSVEYKTAAKKDGRITARQFNFIVDSGAYATHGPGVTEFAILHGQGPYSIPNVAVEARLVYTNKLPFGAYRGYGGPQIHYAGESQLDELAETLGMDPVELRMKNAITGQDRVLTGQPVPHAAFKETLRRAAESAGWDWENNTKPVREPGDPRKKRGIGVASMQHVSAIFTSAALMKMDIGGSITILTGGSEVGGGQRTVLSQIAAEALGVPLENVSIVMSDTLTTAYDWATDASRTTYNTGNAILRAAAEVKERFLEIAGSMLEADPKDLEMENGEVYVQSAPDRKAAYNDVVMFGLYADGGAIMGRGSFFQKLEYDAPKDLKIEGWHDAGLYSTFIYATQIAEVEVDTETGQVEVIGLHSAHDVGKAISKEGCEGQIEGAAATGIGWLFSEEIIFEDGAVTNPTLLDYKLPTSLDAPKVQTLLVEEADPSGPFGAKGIGEPSLVPTAAAVANAIYDAVGVRINTMPFTADRVLAALEAQDAS